MLIPSEMLCLGLVYSFGIWSTLLDSLLIIRLKPGEGISLHKPNAYFTAWLVPLLPFEVQCTSTENVGRLLIFVAD